jgi:CheY-like chemotaxis protein
MARILLADDDAATRDLVRRALTGDGHDVIVTEDGGAALDQIKAKGAAFDLLISDVQMPVVDGIGLAAATKAARPGIAILLMTGFAGEIGSTAHLKPELKGIIAKPFTLEQIRSTVRAAIKG